MTFPFERVATTGEQALATWGELKTTGRGVPVVIGNGESVGILTNAFNPLRPKKLSLSLAEILLPSASAIPRILSPSASVGQTMHETS
jgi:hypothetical protein